MTRMVPPNRGMRGINIETPRGTRQINTNSQGIMEVNNKKTVRKLKEEGFTEASLAPYEIGDANRGFNCVQCGFGSWFRKCSRCGNDNDRLETDSSNG
ncbi:MAG: hypothetical protein EBS18_02705 [Actinobacteria bacterium]|nr:hypothetical protein [Actinomycetota bacterium]